MCRASIVIIIAAIVDGTWTRCTMQTLLCEAADSYFRSLVLVLVLVVLMKMLTRYKTKLNSL